jgi:hypothetical protein
MVRPRLRIYAGDARALSVQAAFPAWQTLKPATAA